MVLTDDALREDLPAALPDERDALVSRLLRAYGTQLDEQSTAAETIHEALFLPTARGVALDTLGWEKGPLGPRRGRGDDTYRRFLIALPNAFGGQHRRTDIAEAVAAGIVTDTAAVELDEDVTTNSYEVTLTDWQAHSTDLVEFLADYADAPVVRRTGPITYDWGTSAHLETGRDAGTATTIDHGTSAPLVGDTGGATAVVEYEDGFGGFAFGEGYQFDVEEATIERIEDSGFGGSQTVYSGESATGRSPLTLGGKTTVGGELTVRSGSDSGSGDGSSTDDTDGSNDTGG